MQRPLFTDSNVALSLVIESSGLAPVIARGAIARCCSRIGVEPGDLSLRDVPRLLPHLEPILRLYLKPGEAAAHLAQLSALGR